MKAHWRPASQPCLRNMSTISPYFENSSLSSGSVMPSGKDPTKIFRGASPGSARPASAGWYWAAPCRWPYAWPLAAGSSGAGKRAAGGSTSCPNMPWFRAMVTSQARSEPGNASTRSQLSFACRACPGVAKLMKAHWRPVSQPVLMKRSVIAPYFENSDRSCASVMSSGREPTKIFLGPCAASYACCGLCAAPGAGAIGPCPNIPWLRASVTSHGRKDPGNCRTPFEYSAAWNACSAVSNETNAHWRPDSQFGLRNVSSTWPYLENSARSSSSVMPSGSEPTKIFFTPLLGAIGGACVMLPYVGATP
mmetsp:Transcript_121684/g.344842  ORF Transcript_121684/g.344842 Transcript_121684/m.344842 type:complete len:307 (-) Transcript_121684:489-1409(-)